MFTFVSTCLIKSWWVILFMLICYMGYEQSLCKGQYDYLLLEKRLKELQLEKKRELAIQEDLILQINSQSDPDWIELTLMRVLGLVPKNQTKVYFAPP